MKKLIRTTLAIVAILMVCAAPGQADRGGWHRGGHGGGGWFWGPILGAEILGLGLMEMANPYNYSYPGPVIQQPPPQIYYQPSPLPAQTGYWYYCSEVQAYYPYTRECPGGWIKVVPSPPPL